MDPTARQKAEGDDALQAERRNVRALRIEISALRAGLRELRSDVERVERSAAWRWGHAAARLLSRVSGRAPRTRGAVASALATLDSLERTRPGENGRGAPPPAALGTDTSFCIKIAAPSQEAAARWGDLHFAEALARELRARGHRTIVQVLPEWDGPAGDACDVAVVLRGVRRYAPRPHQLNVLWVISHPQLVGADECDGFDLLLAASPPLAERLGSLTKVPVQVLEQATDPARFFPEPVPEHRRELVFVGNARGVRRRLLQDLLPTERELGVFGAGWEATLDRRHLVATHVPNQELRHVYSSAGIVLNDHWDDMRAFGIASNRLYDAVACGALVISDAIAGVEECFAGAVVTYETPRQLRELVDHFLARPSERAARGGAGRAAVLAAHTFAHRVDALLLALGPAASAASGARAVTAGP